MAVSSTERPATVQRRVMGSISTLPTRTAWFCACGPRALRTTALTRRDHLAGAEGFGDVVVGAEFQAEHPVDLVIPGGAEQHRRPVLLGSQPSADLNAVHAGQADVEQHARRPVIRDRRQALPDRRSPPAPGSPPGSGTCEAGLQWPARPRRRARPRVRWSRVSGVLRRLGAGRGVLLRLTHAGHGHGLADDRADRDQCDPDPEQPRLGDRSVRSSRPGTRSSRSSSPSTSPSYGRGGCHTSAWAEPPDSIPGV